MVAPPAGGGAPAGDAADGRAGALSAHEGFKFTSLLRHHNLPYPAIEPIHLQPVLIFDLADYAERNLTHLARHEGFDEIRPGSGHLAWAHDQAPADEAAALRLARAMEVAEDSAWLGSLPRALSWVNQQTFFGSLALVIMAVLLFAARRRPGQEVPRGRLQGAIEALVVFVRDDIVRPNIRHHPKAWIGHFVALFLAILAFNLMGLVPGAGTASGNPGINAGFALCTLGAMLVCGIRVQGIGPFFRNLVPYEWSWNPLHMSIYLILLMIELLGLLIKPAALTIRLFANMFGGHAVLLAFVALGAIVQGSGAHAAVTLPLGILGIVLTVAIYALELLVAFIQAYVFTLLSAVFIGGALSPDH